MLKKIGGIKLGVFSPEMIRKQSVIEIKTPDLYDKDGFPIEGGLMDPHLGVSDKGRRCKTCGQTVERCVGHFGRLELVRPVIHVGFFKKVDLLLNTTCRSCGRILLSDAELDSIKAKNVDSEDLQRALLARAKTKTTCPYCATPKTNLKLDPPTNFYIIEKGDKTEEILDPEDKNIRFFANQIREWLCKIPSSDLERIGMKNIRPEWFVLTVLPIPPVNMHPPITLDNGVKSEDDLTFKLTDIVTVNNRLRDNINAGTPQLIIEDLWALLQYNINTYINNNTPGVPPAKHRSGRPLKTIIQRIKGKGGIIRNNLMGKRVNYAARTTITPDMFIDVDEVGIPEPIAEILTIKERITEQNLDKYKEMLKNTDLIKYVQRQDGTKKRVSPDLRDALYEELAPGFGIERNIVNGDWILFNRQPSLHRASVMGNRVRIMKGNTFRVSGTSTAPYNADFDGDEMNVHVPQTPEGIMETKELVALEHNIISPRYGGPIIALKEDNIAGAFLLSLSSTKISVEQAMYYFQICGIDNPPKPDVEGKFYSGKLIFSSLLPEDITITYNNKLSSVLNHIDENSPAYKQLKKDATVVIENGVFKSGILDKVSVGEGTARIVQEIFDKHGPKAVMAFYNKLNKITSDIVSRTGISVGLKDYEPPKGIDAFKEKQQDEFFKRTRTIEKNYKDGKLEKVPGKNIKDSFEHYMISEAATFKSSLEKFILNAKITDLYNTKPKYNTLTLVLSGAKGSAMNYNNIIGLFGQTAVREKRPSRGYTKRVLPMYKREDEGSLARGFVTKGFYSGMSARETFFHAMGGRQGEVDTGVSTKISGYFYRRVSNALRDLIVDQDYSVRTADNKIIQYLYGEDGVYSQKTYRGELFTENRLQNILEKAK